MVEVLVQHGARIQAVRLKDVLLTWDRRLVQFFLDRGADPVTHNPFMCAFQNRVQRVLRPYVDYKKAHPEFADSLQAQVDRALRHFAGQADLKSISLLLWAGANPRSSGRISMIDTQMTRNATPPLCESLVVKGALKR